MQLGNHTAQNNLHFPQDTQQGAVGECVLLIYKVYLFFLERNKMLTVTTIRTIRTHKRTTTTMSATVPEVRPLVSSDDGVSVGSSTVEVDGGCNVAELDGVGHCRSWLISVFVTLELLNSLSITSVKFTTRGTKE